MGTIMTISIKGQFGRAAIDYEDGVKLNQALVTPLKQGLDIDLDFEGVDVFASPFFNASLASLVKDFDPADLNRRLHLRNISATGRSVARRAIENAKVMQDTNFNDRLASLIDAIESED